MKFEVTAWAVFAVLSFGVFQQASAERIFGLTTQNWIAVFDSEMPGATTAGGAVTGLATNDVLVAMDYQPPAATSSCSVARAMCTGSIAPREATLARHC